MQVKSFELCSSCRQIRPIMGDGKPSDTSVEDLLNGNGYRNPVMRLMLNRMALQDLRGNGGCSKCIELFERAVAEI